MAMQPEEERLARELVALVEARTSPRAALLQSRIDKCLAYLEDVVAPNMHTIVHVRRYLTGAHDSFPPVIPEETPS